MDKLKPLPDSSDVENFNELQIIEYVDNIMKRLEIFKDKMNLDEVKDCFLRISLLHFDCEKYLDKICDHFIEKDKIDVFYFYLKSLHSKLNVNDEILDFLYNSLINFSDSSVNFARKVHSSKILPYVIDNCISGEYDNEQFLTNCIYLIHNIARDIGNKITHKLPELKQTLVKFIKNINENNLAVLSMLILSYIVEEQEIELLDEGSNTIKRLLELITKTMKLKGRTGNYSIPELMQGIYYISCNDKMKLKISEYGGIEILIDILNTNIENEIEFTLGIIWNLCFHSTIKRKLIDVYQIVNVIEPFRNHKSPKIKTNFDGIMWEIENKKETFHIEELKSRKSIDSSSDKKYFDVFISYAHENQSKVLEIRENLIQYNIRVWIDKEQMTGSILEAMARGIENSKVIVIGMSKHYMTKPNCRSEAEYAYQRQKPIIPMILEYKFKPEGWLGILQGSKLYFEFSERRNTQEMVEGLVKSIENSLVEIGCSVEEIEKIDGKKKFLSNKSGGGDDCLKRNESVKAWGKVEVNKWLEKSKIDHLKKKMNELDGSLLYLMLDIRVKSPEYFNKTLKNEFGMKFFDVLKFHRALNDLTI